MPCFLPAAFFFAPVAFCLRQMRAELVELGGVVAHRALAGLAGVGAVLADGDLAEVLRGLPERDELVRRDEAEGEVIERRRRALELARVADGARRLELAGLDAEAAVHAFAHVDVEAAHGLLLRRRVLHEVDGDALDGAGALAALAARADVHLHLEEAAVARREHLA